MKIIKTEHVPIKMWLDDIEDGALGQAKNLASLPFVYRHVALMPDAHQGFGMPIGGVFGAENVIIPNAVGVDIGCGMCAVKTPVPEVETNILKKIMGHVRQAVPVGFNHHKTPQDHGRMPEISGSMPVVEREYKSALKQIGTLGGGNHFIEVQEGGNGHIWIMIHSGSRNIGKQVADHYNRLAGSLNEKFKHKIPKQYQLYYLPLDTEEGQQYLREMKFCVDFALANRRLMMHRVIEIFGNETGAGAFGEMINIAHNYAVIENHYGKDLVVHRKGATSAKEGETGIIPGSQGTSSYIVKGKGNKESLRRPGYLSFASRLILSQNTDIQIEDWRPVQNQNNFPPENRHFHMLGLS